MPGTNRQCISSEKSLFNRSRLAYSKKSKNDPKAMPKTRMTIDKLIVNRCPSKRQTLESSPSTSQNMRPKSLLTKDLLESVSKSEREICPEKIQLNLQANQHYLSDSLALKRCMESLSDLQSIGSLNCFDSPKTMKVISHKHSIGIKPIVEDKNDSSGCSQSHLPGHKTNDNKILRGDIKKKPTTSQMTICSGISRNKEERRVSEIKPMSSPSRKSRSKRILTKDLLERIEKTEFTTTSARNNRSSGPSERDNFLLGEKTPVFGLDELICSRRSETDSENSFRDAACMVKIVRRTPKKGTDPYDLKNESNLMTPARTSLDIPAITISRHISRMASAGDWNSPG